MNKDLVLYLHSASAFQLLHAGVKLKLFESLNKNGTLAFSRISDSLKLKEQPTRCLLFGLKALGLINESNNQYKNSASISELFNNNEFDLFKKMVLIQAHIMYLGQTDFVESLEQNTNAGLKRYFGTGKTIYEKLEHNPKLKKVFYDYMEAYSDYSIKFLLKNVNFSKDKLVLDVGGGDGSNAIAIAKQNPHLTVTLLDLPVAKSMAYKKIKQNNLTKQIRFFTGDMFKEDFPKNQDSVLFIHQLVIWSPEQNKSLLKKAFDSLNEKGRVVIFSSIAEDTEDKPLMAALDTVYFRAIAAGNGMVYPWKDYEKMLYDVGFRKIKKIRCSSWTPHGIVVGYR